MMKQHAALVVYLPGFGRHQPSCCTGVARNRAPMLVLERYVPLLRRLLVQVAGTVHSGSVVVAELAT